MASGMASLAIFGRGVAKGIAKWALFAPSVWGILIALDFSGMFGANVGWAHAVFGPLLLAGLAYLFNKVDIPGR